MPEPMPTAAALAALRRDLIAAEFAPDQADALLVAIAPQVVLTSGLVVTGDTDQPTPAELDEERARWRR